MSDNEILKVQDSKGVVKNLIQVASPLNKRKAKKKNLKRLYLVPAQKPIQRNLIELNGSVEPKLVPIETIEKVEPKNVVKKLYEVPEPIDQVITAPVIKREPQINSPNEINGLHHPFLPLPDEKTIDSIVFVKSLKPDNLKEYLATHSTPVKQRLIISPTNSIVLRKKSPTDQPYQLIPVSNNGYKPNKNLHDDTITRYDPNSDGIKNVVVFNNRTPPGNKTPSELSNQLVPYTKDFNDSFLNENDDFYNNLDPDYQLPKNKPTEKKRPAANFLQKTSSNDKLFNNDPRYNNILHEPKNEIFFKNLDSENHVPQSNKMPLNPLKSKTISNSNDKTLHDSAIDHNSDELKNVIVLNNQTPPGNKAPSKRTNQLVLDTKNNNVKNKIVTTKKIYYNNSDIENPMSQNKKVIYLNSNQTIDEQTKEENVTFETVKSNKLIEIIEKPIYIERCSYLHTSRPLWPWLILLPFAFFFLTGFFPYFFLLTKSKNLLQLRFH